MKRKISAVIMTSLMVLTVLVMCSNVSADGVATFRGRVRPIGTTGTVEVTGGAAQSSSPIGPLGNYFVTIGVKFEGASYKVTAYSNRGSQSKTIENVRSGSTYIINFNFGEIFNIPQASNPANDANQDSSSSIGTNPSSPSTTKESVTSTIIWLLKFFGTAK